MASLLSSVSAEAVLNNVSNARLTVFTPTFNRAETLPRLYASLLEQVCVDFEWLIVDDGSTDATANLVRSWQMESKLDVRYIWQENAGKHVAHNRGAQLARGGYFICVDSDDWLVEGAISHLLTRLDALPAVASGLVFPRGQADTAGDHIAAWPIPTGTLLDLADIRMAWGYSGETIIVFETEGLRRHPFPVFPGETYPFEDIAYLDMKGDLRFVAHAEPLVQFQYRDDGLTRGVFSKWLANPQGALAMFAKRYEVAGEYGAFIAFKQRAKSELNRIGLVRALGRPVMAGSPCRPLTALLMLPGIAVSRLRFGGGSARGAK